MNHDKVPVEIEMTIDADADFADLFEVKDKLEKKGKTFHRAEDKRLVLGYERDSFHRETWITANDAVEIRDKTLVFRTTIAPHAQWSTTIEVATILREGQKGRIRPKYKSSREEAHPALDESLGEGIAQAPKLSCSWQYLERTYRRSIVDLAALRFKPLLAPGSLPAAGLPWFMAIFGRDSLITSLQALPF